MPLENVNADIRTNFDDEKESEYSFDGNAPDGGWGWVVVFGSFMVHVLADGVTYSFGALTTEFVTHFNASRESVGWMASILVGMTLTSGPLASILCNRYGFRLVTIAGSVIASIGFCAPFFCPQFWFLYLSASVLTGIGFGLVYLPSIVTVSIYFQKHRAFAIGLAVCGSGIGTFVFSPLIEYCNEEYGWQGTMLIVGGLILNCMASGAVYRPLRSYEIENRLSSNNSEASAVLPNNVPQSRMDTYELSDESFRKNSKNLHFISAVNIHHSSPNADSRFIRSDTDIQQIDNSHKKNMLKLSHPHLVMSSQMSLQLTNLDRERTSQTVKSVNTSVFTESISFEDLKACMKENFDDELLRSPIFLLFAFSNFFTSIGFNAPFLYAKDRALQMNILNSQASFLISTIGIGNTIGRVIFGYLSSKSFINRLHLYNASLTVSGIVVMFSCFALTYAGMVSYTVAFGLLTGTYVTLTSVVLVDLLGIEKLNAAFGMVMIFQGAAVFIGPPLAGWIYDVTNSFDWSFWVCGAFLTVSGVMLYLVYCSKEFRQQRNNNKNDDP